MGRPLAKTTGTQQLDNVKRRAPLNPRNAPIIGQGQFFGKVQRCLKRSQSAE